MQVEDLVSLVESFNDERAACFSVNRTSDDNFTIGNGVYVVYAFLRAKINSCVDLISSRVVVPFKIGGREARIGFAECQQRSVSRTLSHRLRGI